MNSSFKPSLTNDSANLGVAPHIRYGRIKTLDKMKINDEAFMTFQIVYTQL
jgi:hypothetical protein